MDKPGSFWEWLNIIGNFIASGLLALVLAHSFLFWLDNYPIGPMFNIQVKLFWVSLIIAIITVLMQWIQSRVNSIIRSLENLKGGRKECQKKKSLRRKKRM